jgi:hypothetical protein
MSLEEYTDEEYSASFRDRHDYKKTKRDVKRTLDKHMDTIKKRNVKRTLDKHMDTIKKSRSDDKNDMRGLERCIPMASAITQERRIIATKIVDDNLDNPDIMALRLMCASFSTSQYEARLRGIEDAKQAKQIQTPLSLPQSFIINEKESANRSGSPIDSGDDPMEIEET